MAPQSTRCSTLSSYRPQAANHGHRAVDDPPHPVRKFPVAFEVKFGAHCLHIARGRCAMDRAAAAVARAEAMDLLDGACAHGRSASEIDSSHVGPHLHMTDTPDCLATTNARARAAGRPGIARTTIGLHGSRTVPSCCHQPYIFQNGHTHVETHPIHPFRRALGLAPALCPGACPGAALKPFGGSSTRDLRHSRDTV